MTSPGAAAPSRNEFGRGWKVLIASLLGTAFGASPLPFNTIGFFIDPLQQEFGWTRTEISLGITIYGVLGALLAPVFGWLADRFGVRLVALASLTTFALIFASFSIIPGNLSWYYALWVLVGLFGIGSTPITWSRAINLWFFKQRGLALGLTLVGTSISAMALPIITTWLINDFGWRVSYAALALLPLGIALPIGLLWFREPKPEERPPEIAAAGAVSLPGRSLREAMREPRFWILWASIALVTIAYSGALVHLPSMLGARGFERSEAAAVMSVFGLSIFAGRIITGYLLDKFWAPIVTLPILCLPALSCWILLGDGPLAFAVAIAAAPCWPPAARVGRQVRWRCRHRHRTVQCTHTGAVPCAGEQPAAPSQTPCNQPEGGAMHGRTNGPAPCECARAPGDMPSPTPRRRQPLRGSGETVGRAGPSPWPPSTCARSGRCV